MQEVKAKTTSTEFEAWHEYFRLEQETPTKQDYYLAQIAAEVASLMQKKRTSIKDRIIKFAKPKAKRIKWSEKQKKEYTRHSKAFWKGLVCKH